MVADVGRRMPGDIGAGGQRNGQWSLVLAIYREPVSCMPAGLIALDYLIHDFADDTIPVGKENTYHIRDKIVINTSRMKGEVKEPVPQVKTNSGI